MVSNVIEEYMGSFIKPIMNEGLISPVRIEALLREGNNVSFDDFSKMANVLIYLEKELNKQIASEELVDMEREERIGELEQLKAEREREHKEEIENMEDDFKEKKCSDCTCPPIIKESLGNLYKVLEETKGMDFENFGRLIEDLKRYSKELK